MNQRRQTNADYYIENHNGHFRSSEWNRNCDGWAVGRSCSRVINAGDRSFWTGVLDHGKPIFLCSACADAAIEE